jgi:hypothetical protein
MGLDDVHPSVLPASPFLENHPEHERTAGWEDDFEAALDVFPQLKEFFRRAAEAGRCVVFVAGGPAEPTPSGQRPPD